MADDLRQQLAGLLGIQGGQGGQVAAAPAAPAPAAAGAAGGAAASPPAGAPAIDYSALAGEIVRQLGGAPGGQAPGAAPAAGAQQATPAAGTAPSMLALLQQMGAQGAPGVPAGPRAAAPRKVNNLEQDGGFVDVFSLSEDEVKAMPIEKLVEHFERARDAARTASGAPPLPRALRNQARR